MDQIYLNPQEEDQKFLTKFLVSDQKLPLYGLVPAMKLNSELIKSLADKLTQENELAANIPLQNEKSLKTVWLYINGLDKEFKHVAYTGIVPYANKAVGMWPWLNYFDVPYTGQDFKQYTFNLIASGPYFAELTKPENKSIFDDVVKKITFIVKGSKESKIVQDKLNEYFRPKENDIKLVLYPTKDYEAAKVFTIDKSKLEDELKRNNISIENLLYFRSQYNPDYYEYSRENPEFFANNGSLPLEGPVIKLFDRYYTYPELKNGKYVSHEIFEF